jgi:hypothetical protein
MPRIRASHSEPRPSPGKADQANIRLTYPGKWLAWTEDESTLVAVSDSPEELRSAAMQAGHSRFIYDWVPPAGVREAGGSYE